jgi:arylsulfatase A-like enzyme
MEDLEQRGLLDETLVLLISEHGRTPKLSNAPGGGREHWSYAYWNLLAGAGVNRGCVIGATDRQGGYPIQRPINPKDVLASVYHLLGFDPQTVTIPSREDRPVHLLPYGEIIPEALA